MKKYSKVLLALILVITLTFTACSTAWISEAEEIVAALIPAATNILSLVAALKGGSISTTDAAMIQSAGTQANTDLQLVATLITSYDAADATAKPGILSQIQAALSSASTNLSAILPALHVTDPKTVAKITAIVGLVQTEIQSLVAIIPIVNPTASAAMVKLATRQAAKTPPMKAKDFVKAFNSTMTAKTGFAELDAATPHCKIKGKSFWSKFTNELGTVIGDAKYGGVWIPAL